MSEVQQTQWADKLGAISAFLCIVHCLTVPTLLAIGIGFVGHPVVAALFIVIAFFSIYKVTSGRWTKGVSTFLWLVFIGFVCCLLLEERSVVFEYGMFLFSSAIILGHLYNILNRKGLEVE